MEVMDALPIVEAWIDRVVFILFFLNNTNTAQLNDLRLKFRFHITLKFSGPKSIN
jgi:hypothetical protein